MVSGLGSTVFGGLGVEGLGLGGGFGGVECRLGIGLTPEP